MGEMKGKFANEEMYKRWKRRLIVIGSILLAVGVGFLIAGFIRLSQVLKDLSNGGQFGAIGLIGIGGFSTIFSLSCFSAAFRREMTSYSAATVAPVAKDVADYASDEIIPNVTKSIQDAKSDEETKYCSECGAKNKKSANFCSKCGKKFE